MASVRIPSKQRFIFDGVSWKRYTHLLRGFSDRHLRITYDRGFLEVMTISHEHENLSAFLDMLVLILAREMKLHFHLGGSTTLRKRRKYKGLEPDKCYWIATAAQVRGKKVIDLRKDPPPDLALEVDITHSSLDRMRIYAAIRVPEVWRWNENGLVFLALGSDRAYAPAATSATFPVPITPTEIMEFIKMRDTMDDSDMIEPFTAWIRQKIAAAPKG